MANPLVGPAAGLASATPPLRYVGQSAAQRKVKVKRGSLFEY